MTSIDGAEIMAEQEPGVRALLFERLVDRQPRKPGESKPHRTLGRAELRESVGRELGRLFNTRSPLPADCYAQAEHTAINYGIPDLLAFAPWNPEDRNRLAGILVKAIEAFEPRLRNVRIVVEPIPRNPKGLRARVDAVLVVESVREPVSFESTLENREGDWCFQCNLLTCEVTR